MASGMHCDSRFVNAAVLCMFSHNAITLLIEPSAAGLTLVVNWSITLVPVVFHITNSCTCSIYWVKVIQEK